MQMCVCYTETHRERERERERERPKVDEWCSRKVCAVKTSLPFFLRV